MSFSADGNRLVTTGVDRTGAFWRLDGDRSIGTVLEGQDGPVTEVAFASEGTLLSAALNGTVAVRDAADGAIESTLRLPGEVLSVSADPTGPRMAAGGTDTLVVARLDGEERRDVDIGSAWANQVAFAPDGSAVAVALDNRDGDPDIGGPGTGSVRFVEPETGSFIGPTIDLDEAARGVTYAPGGEVVAVVTENNLVHFYDTADGREIGEPIANVDAPFTAVAFSPDGSRLAVGIASGAVRQYDADTHQPIGEPLEGDPNGVFGVAYSADGSLLAGSSVGFSTTRLWDARAGRPLGSRLTGGRVPYSYRTFLVEEFMASRPAFAPDGRSLVTPGFDGATVLWDIDPASWSEAACAIAGRDLSDEEWDRYLPGRDHHEVCAGG